MNFNRIHFQPIDIYGSRQHHRETSKEKRRKICCYASSNFQKTVNVRNRIFFSSVKLATSKLPDFYSTVSIYLTYGYPTAKHSVYSPFSYKSVVLVLLESVCTSAVRAHIFPKRRSR